MGTEIVPGSQVWRIRWMHAEAIRNPIHAFLPVQCSMCEIVHCHNEEGFFSSSDVAVSS